MKSEEAAAFEQLVQSQTELTKGLLAMSKAFNRQAEAISTLAGAIHSLADSIACAIDPDDTVLEAEENPQKPSTYLDGTPRP